MRAIQVTAWGTNPAFFPDAVEPQPTSPEQVSIRVLASGLAGVVRSQSTGKHYSVQGAPLPYTPGADGVGLDPEGNLVYFISIATGGGFGETIVVPKQVVYPIPLPSPSITDADKKALAVQIAGLANPAMSSWMALQTRTSDLPKDFTILILGVTSLSGRVAIPLARHLGAGRIIGVARNASAMAPLALDERIALEDTTSYTPETLGSVDVVLDYLWGAPAAQLLASLPSNARAARPVQWVQIGMLAGDELPLNGAILRSKNITLRGAGPGSWSLGQLAKEMGALVGVLAGGGLGEFDFVVRKFEEVEAGFADRKARTVFTP